MVGKKKGKETGNRKTEIIKQQMFYVLIFAHGRLKWLKTKQNKKDVKGAKTFACNRTICSILTYTANGTVTCKSFFGGVG